MTFATLHPLGGGAGLQASPVDIDSAALGLVGAGRAASVAVVIPYFQVKPGLLATALRSIAAQELAGPASIEIIVVDDSSPSPAEVELVGLSMPAHCRLRVLRVPNGGPGGARNAGLDLVSPDTDYVAFLDSDDTWRPDHLARAFDALQRGYDFYFSDHSRPDINGEASAFALDERLNDWLARPEEAPFAQLADRPDCYGFKPGRAVNELIENYMAQTSTVVFRRSTYGAIRFDTRLRSAGEDHLFWLKIASTSDAICFSTANEVMCGSGVNIYFSAFDWAHPASARRVGYLTLLYTLISQNLPLDRRGRDIVRRRKESYGQAFAYIWLLQSMKSRRPDWTVFRELQRADATSIARLIVWACKAGFGRLSNRDGFSAEWN